MHGGRPSLLSRAPAQRAAPLVAAVCLVGAALVVGGVHAGLNRTMARNSTECTTEAGGGSCGTGAVSPTLAPLSNRVQRRRALSKSVGEPPYDVYRLEREWNQFDGLRWQWWSDSGMRRLRMWLQLPFYSTETGAFPITGAAMRVAASCACQPCACDWHARQLTRPAS